MNASLAPAMPPARRCLAAEPESEWQPTGSRQPEISPRGRQMLEMLNEVFDGQDQADADAP